MRCAHREGTCRCWDAQGYNELKTLVLGGYGNFGARISRALAGDSSIDLFIGGRDARRAATLAEEVGGGARAISMDLAAPDFADRLRHHGIELVIHTAGPFQQQEYTVAAAAASADAHYIDLADGRRFVCDFPAAMNAPFRAAARCAISGASTVPALSSAVVASLCSQWPQIDSIDICIAPAQTAPRGLATLEAVLSYCGEPLQVWEDGRWQTRRGWAAPSRVSFARMRPRAGALCDIPDLELFPASFGVKDRVMFRAALEVGMGQRAFAFLAALREVGLISRPARFARFFERMARATDFLGSSLGGMVVRVKGIGPTGRPARRAWHIAAEGDHGPEIPCMAAILLARRLAKGRPVSVGACTATGLLDLEDFNPEFARWGMVTDTLDEPQPHAQEVGP
jgi:saccharopine dehydrogenase-like NADP-dependent oxidoreductase